MIAYAPCIEHKILFPRGLSRLAEEMQKAVEAGYWSPREIAGELRRIEQSFDLENRSKDCS